VCSACAGEGNRRVRQVGVAAHDSEPSLRGRAVSRIVATPEARIIRSDDGPARGVSVTPREVTRPRPCNPAAPARPVPPGPLDRSGRHARGTSERPSGGTDHGRRRADGSRPRPRRRLRPRRLSLPPRPPRLLGRRERPRLRLPDAYPVSPGHTLVVTRRVVPTWFEATPAEQAAVWALVAEVKAHLDRTHAPAGYNVGFNAGAAAGQTVFHLHVHVIPRYEGDVPDPRGGVRLAIPHKGNYLAPQGERSRLAQGGRADPFLEHLRPLFARASEVAVVAAFAQQSGVEALDALLHDALVRGARIRLLTSDYLHFTQARALRHLLDLAEATAAADPDDPSALPGALSARVLETAALPPAGTTLHPKAWFFAAPSLTDEEAALRFVSGL